MIAVDFPEARICAPAAEAERAPEQASVALLLLSHAFGARALPDKEGCARHLMNRLAKVGAM